MKQNLLLAGCLVLSIFVLGGCSNGSEPFEKKTYTPETQIKEIKVDVRDREIEVAQSEDGQIHIQYVENSKEYYDISISDQNALTMIGANSKGWFDYLGGKPPIEYRKISLRIPNALLESLTISTTNADISISELTVNESIHISSNGGNIIVRNLDVGNAIRLTAKNGNISGTVMGSYEDFAIHSKVKKGKSNLPDRKEEGEKELHVSCNNGDISIDFQR